MNRWLDKYGDTSPIGGRVLPRTATYGAVLAFRLAP